MAIKYIYGINLILNIKLKTPLFCKLKMIKYFHDFYLVQLAVKIYQFLIGENLIYDPITLSLIVSVCANIVQFKRSNIEKTQKAKWAEKALDNFEVYLYEVNHWFKYQSHYEVSFWVRKFYKIQKKLFIRAKALINRLNDDELILLFIEFENSMNSVPCNLKLFNYFSEKEKIKAFESLEKSANDMNEIGKKIISKLIHTNLYNTRLIPKWCNLGIIKTLKQYCANIKKEGLYYGRCNNASQKTRKASNTII